MTTVKKSIFVLLQLAVLYAAAACVSIYVPNVFLLRYSATLVLMVLALSLLRYFADHIIESDTRKYLVGIAGLIALWIVLRGAKYIAFEETETVARHIWYLYYVPALMIPFLSVLAAFSVGDRETRHPRRALLLAAAVTVVMILFVLTNDLHQFVFRFQPGFAGWDSEYSHGPLFAVIYCWITLLFIVTIYVLFSRCRVSASRKLVWVPMLPALFGILYLIFGIFDAWPRLNGHLFGEFPEAVCFTMAGIWLALICIGLIPSNAGYGKLFRISDLSAQITDRDGRVIYSSPSAVPLTAQQLASETSVSLDPDTRLHRKEVRGGFVYWQDDITELNRINEELWTVGEQLAEETELVRLENELKEERAQIEAKSKAYDDIAAKVLPQSQRIAELCAHAESEPERFAEDMSEVCLLAVFIKRYANLFLLAADREKIDAGELELAVAESLRCVSDMGIPAQESMSENASIPAQMLLGAYAAFGSLLERALPSLRGIQVSIGGDVMKASMEGAALGPYDGVDITVDDGVSYIRIPLREAGEAI